jgi:metal-sulfur cluster biosynthetic enzyme
MVTKTDVLTALGKCIDPELNADIVSLGLIYNITISDGKDVKLTLTMTSPMCPVISIILADVQLRMEAVNGVGKIDIDLVWEPMWSPEMMNDELKYRSV